jgi:hypothetical protein
VYKHSPVSAFHIVIVLSRGDGDANICPSGDHAMRPMGAARPRSVRTSFTPGGCPSSSVSVYRDGSIWFFFLMIEPYQGAQP